MNLFSGKRIIETHMLVGEGKKDWELGGLSWSSGFSTNYLYDLRQFMQSF